MSDSRIERWLTIAPATLLLLSIAFLPMFELAAMSVSSIDWREGKAHWSYAGLANYARALRDSLFHAGITNTVAFALAAVGLQMVLGFALALMTTKVTRGRVFYRTVFILPILVPGIVIGAIWKLMYSFNFGVLNQMLGLFGVAPVDWLGNPSIALLAVIAVDVWHWTPFVYLLLLAGLESLPQDIYESAKVDGATFLQELRYITLPLMLPTIMVTLVFRTLVAFKVFDEIYLLTAGGPGTATEVVSYTIYRRFFTEGQMGYGSSLSVIVLFVLALLFILANAVTRRRRGQP
jgi:multiple sugar transport system permease protein